MYRAEIIANRSVQDEIIEALETGITGILYTIISEVHGRGNRNRKLGTTIWPELNFVLFAYLADGDAERMRKIISDIKARFPNEGINLFMIHSID